MGDPKMRVMPSPRQPQLRRLFRMLFVLSTTVCLIWSPAAAQTEPETPSQMSPDDLKKFSTLFGHLGELTQKMQAHVDMPAPRTQSRLLPMLPESTLVYAAIPNYGEASHQALGVFQQEVKENAQLRAWWEKGEMATEGPKIVDALEKFYQLSQYLGDEIVVSAASEGKEDPKFLLLSEVRKPGLKDFLRHLLDESAGKSKPAALVFDAEEFAAAKSVPSDQPIILVRPDLVVLAENATTLRQFIAHKEQSNTFASTEFGQRMMQGYDGGTTIIAGADFQHIFKLASTSIQKDPSFQRTGFSDMKHLVWERKNIAGQPVSELELSFTRPRRGVASWLAVSGPIGSLDFISPKAVLVASLLLKNPAQIFDEVKDLATAKNPSAFDSLSQAERQMNLSLRDDLFSHLAGEIAVEVDRLTPPNPQWKLFLKTNDPDALLATLNHFFAASHIIPGHFDENGITYYTVPVPSGQTPLEIGYAIVDNYLIVGSNKEAVAEAVRLHKTGESLAKSGKFQGSLPPDNSGGMSLLLYEDPKAMAGLTLRQFSPELAEEVAKSPADAPPVVMTIRADETTLREASRSGSTDVAGPMIIAAIAIPNLLRARMAANESSAVATIRTVNTAQITYMSSYPLKGYAHDLASLGPNPKAPEDFSPQHAHLIDSTLGDVNCTVGAWCSKSGYRFTVLTTCKQVPCTEYVVVATPVSTNSGTRNFCSTSDAIIHYQIAAPLESAVTAVKCKTWSPLQ